VMINMANMRRETGLGLLGAGECAGVVMPFALKMQPGFLGFDAVCESRVRFHASKCLDVAHGSLQSGATNSAK